MNTSLHKLGGAWHLQAVLGACWVGGGVGGFCQPGLPELGILGLDDWR
jgi:hypothetical protein